MFKVYLAGPITGSSYEEVTDWRETTKEHLKLMSEKSVQPIVGYSPMRGKAYLSKEDKICDSYEDTTMSSVKGINIRDFNDCKTSDVVLVNLLGATRVSIGTVMEIAWARAFKIPIVIVMEKEGNLHDHGMLTYDTIVVNTLTDGVLAVTQILLPEIQYNID